MSLFKRKNSKYWWCKFQHEGREYRESTKETSKRKARDVERQIILDVKNGRKQKKQRAKLLLSEFRCEYIEGHVELRAGSEKSRDNYQRSIDNLLRAPHFREVRLVDVDSHLVGEFIKWRRKNSYRPGKNGVSNATVNQEIIRIKHMMKKAHEWGYVHENKIAEVSVLPVNNERKKKLSPEQETALLEELPDHQKPIVAFALLTGARISNILGLEWSDVDKKGIQFRNAKGGKTYTVAMSDELWSLLQGIPSRGASRYVFVNPRTGTRFKSISSGFRAAVKRAGLGDFRFHDLRHAVAERILTGGSTLVEAMQLLGHTSSQSTLRYLAWERDKLRPAMDKLGKTISEDFLKQGA